MEKQKIAFITGATSGFGKATAIRFAEEGWHLILAGRRSDRLEVLSSELSERFGIDTVSLTLDVRIRQQVEEQLEALPEKWKAVDVLVNNAGLAAGLSAIQEGDVDDWEQMIDTNVKGLLYVSRAVMPWMIARQSGHIVNLGSTAGKDAYANGNVYCATKFAVDAISKSMRIDLLPYGIRVTSVNPGAAETEFANVRFKGDEARAKAVYTGFDPLVAEDIADIIWFAVSRPARVGINDIVVTPLAQANAMYINRKNA
jgi:NADP-dependent 3-hydroxy acid dehydrogenase YdfG